MVPGQNTGKRIDAVVGTPTRRWGSFRTQATLKLETDSPAVQLVTVYGAKGLEYPIVCCPFLWSVRSLAARRDRDIAIVDDSGATLIDLGLEQFSRHVDDAID